MNQQQDTNQQNDGNDKNTDVTRSQHQQAQSVAENANGEENRAEGSADKNAPAHNHSSHQEGEYSKQSDNPTMHPTGKDHEA